MQYTAVKHHTSRKKYQFPIETELVKSALALYKI